MCVGRGVGGNGGHVQLPLWGLRMHVRAGPLSTSSCPSPAPTPPRPGKQAVRRSFGLLPHPPTQAHTQPQLPNAACAPFSAPFPSPNARHTLLLLPRCLLPLLLLRRQAKVGKERTGHVAKRTLDNVSKQLRAQLVSGTAVSGPRVLEDI